MNPTIGTVEMHAGGEPVRIVVSGFPEIPGATILAKRRHAIEHLDHLRRLLMFEPRGHTDMYGVIPVTPDHPEADLAGLVRVSASVTSGRVGRVAFRSVPAFVAHRSTPVAIPGHGEITLDVAYGGAFYAVADAAAFGLRVPGSPIADLVNAAWATTGAVSGRLPLNHPDDADLGFLYGTILTDGADTWSERPGARRTSPDPRPSPSKPTTRSPHSWCGSPPPSVLGSRHDHVAASCRATDLRQPDPESSFDSCHRL